MAENRKSEGLLVTLENATAASNIAAGRFVCCTTAVNTVFSADREVAGNVSSASMGSRIVGVLDESVSANECPVTVWVAGVFQFQVASSISTALRIGQPVFPCISGGGALVSDSGTTGEFPLGTVVGVPTTNEGATSGTYVHVKINPGAMRWLGMGITPDTGCQEWGQMSDNSHGTQTV